MKNKLFFLYICLLMVLFTVHTTQAKVIKSIGVAGGVALPQGDWNPGYTVGAQLNFGETLKYIFIEPYLSYSHAQRSITIGENTEDLTIQYISFGAKFCGYINSKPRGFYVGAAFSYNIISEFTAENGQLVDSYTIKKNNTTKLGYAGLLGYLFTLKNISLFVEANYMLAPGGYNNLQGLVGVDLNL